VASRPKAKRSSISATDWIASTPSSPIRASSCASCGETRHDQAPTSSTSRTERSSPRCRWSRSGGRGRMTIYYGLGAKVLLHNTRARKLRRPTGADAGPPHEQTAGLTDVGDPPHRTLVGRTKHRQADRLNRLGMSINGRGRAQTHGPQWYGSRRPDVVADYGTNRDRSAERL
jgi:hypothetical protein